MTNETFGEWIPLIGDTLLLKYRKMLIDAQNNDIPIEPRPDRVFHCFHDIQPQDVKAVILGQDPYPDGSATGLAFANDPSRRGFRDLSPSLKVVKNSILSLDSSPESCTFDPTLESWRRQGILLLNSALTVRRGVPGSHTLAWKPFVDRVITGLSSETNCCFILLGKVAWSFKGDIFSPERGVFLEYHPAYYARNGIQMPNTIWRNMIDYVKDNYGVTLKLYE